MQIELEALKRRLFDDNQVKNVKFFPGSNADATPEDIAREINKFFADPEAIMSDVDGVDEFYFNQDRQEKFHNRSPLIVKIKVYESDTNLLIREHKRDIRKSKNKDWLVCCLMWAVQNGKRFEVERK